MCKEGWCVGLGQERGCLCEGGGTVWIALKEGGIEKREGETKIFKMGNKEWVFNKKRMLEPPYKLWLT